MCPRLRRPKLRANERFRAVHEHLLHRHDEDQLGKSAVHYKGRPQYLVARDLAGPGDAQCLSVAWYEEQQPDPWINKEVFESIEAMVTQPVRNDQGLIILHLDEARRVAFGRHVMAAVVRGGRDDDIGRAGDE